MAYDASMRGANFGGRFGEAQRAELARLERLATPTSMDCGRLTALRLTATEEADAERIRNLDEKWAEH